MLNFRADFELQPVHQLDSLTKWIVYQAAEFGVSLTKRGGGKGDKFLNSLWGGVELTPRKRG